MKKGAALLMVAILLLGSALSVGIYLLNEEPSTEKDRDDNDRDKEYDNSLGEESRKKWKEYSGRVSSPEVVTVDPGIAKATPGEALETITLLEGLNNFTDSADGTSGGNDSYREEAGGDGEAKMADAPASDDAGTGNNEPREVEEADLVKVIGDHLFVLNSFRGLVTVDISDPANARIAGRCPVIGYPVEMYVVDFLAIITVRTDYNFWYWYWGMDGTENKEEGGTIGTMMYIVNVDDVENPEILTILELEGFPGESRRVGHVIYQVTNTNGWYWYGGGDAETIITSIDFGDPETLGMKDQVRMEGSSNQVHASPTAFYVASPFYDHGWDEPEELYEDENNPGDNAPDEPESLWEHPDNDRWRYYTDVSYLDISDPDGEIVEKDEFRVPGHLEDKYQMDEYGNTFRMVTHFWTGAGESRLYIADIGNPDRIRAMGSLLVDDAGSLMATRFAGERAYTIHLPRSIDPLDVLDLSDPRNPELCDVFEMPGWVTHMEVKGMKILALGVDDSEGKRNIAVSLFDVTDPYEVKMQERVRLGGDHAWSDANWEPKALTVDDTHNIVIVPFNSRDRDTYESSSGFQIVGFDLEQGELSLEGQVFGRYSIERTRVVNDWILATSFRSLQVVNIRKLDTPEVVSVLDLCVNVKDIVPVGNRYIQMAQDWYDGTVMLRTVDSPDDLEAVDTVTLGSRWARLFDLDEGLVIAVNLEEGNSTVGILYEVEADGSGDILTTELSRLPGGMTFRESYQAYGWYRPCYYEDDVVNMGRRSCESAYYPSSGSDTFHVLGNYLVYYNVGEHPCMKWDYCEKNGRYMPRPELMGVDTLVVFDLSELSELSGVPDPAAIELEAYSFSGMAGHGSYLYVHHRMNGVNVVNRTVTDKNGYSHEYFDNEWYNKNYALQIDLSEAASPRLTGNCNIPGELVGAGDGVIYTTSDWNMDGESNRTLNTLRIADGRAVIVSAVNLGPDRVDVVVREDVAYVVSGGYNYYYYYRYPGNGETNTTARIIDLAEPAEPALLSTMTIKGNLELQSVDEKHICLYDSSTSEIIVYSTEGLPELGFEAILRIRERGKVRLYEDSIYVAEGYYGVLAAGI